jgi:hypothetical protein
MTKPLFHHVTDAEAYVAEGARDIADRLHSLSQRVYPRRRRSPIFVRHMTEHPIATAVVVAVAAALVTLFADRLVARRR